MTQVVDSTFAVPPAAEANASRAARVGKGAAALVVHGVVSTVSQMVLVPVALLSWGSAGYGEWVLLSGLVTALKIADLGLQPYAVNLMTAAYAHGDHARVRSILQATLRLHVILAGGLLSLAGVVLFSLPMDRLLAVTTVSGTVVSLVLLILSAELLLSVPGGVLAGLYRATGYLPRAAINGTCQQALTLIVTVVMLRAGVGFVTIAAARLAVGVVTVLYVVWDLKRLHAWLRIFPLTGSAAFATRMILPGVLFLFVPLVDYFAIQAILLIVQRSIAANEVARFATHRTLAGAAMMLSGMVLNAAWPELTSMEARGERGALDTAHRLAVKLNFMLSGVTLLFIVPAAAWIYPLWTARRLSFDIFMLVLLGARALLWSVWNSSATVLLATNRQAFVPVLTGGSAVIAVAVAFWAVPALGVRGAALSLLAGDLAISAWGLPLLAARATGARVAAFWKDVLRIAMPPFVMTPAAAVLLWLFGNTHVAYERALFGAAMSSSLLVSLWMLRPEVRLAWDASAAVRRKWFATDRA